MSVLFIIGFIALILLLIIGARRARQRSESKLGILEHPSTFEKPPIEMVSEKEGDIHQKTDSPES